MLTWLVMWTIIWVPIGVAVGTHSQNRGDGFYFWFLTVLLLGLIGLLLYIAVGPRGPPLSDEELEAKRRENEGSGRLLLSGLSDEEIEEWKETKRNEKS